MPWSAVAGAVVSYGLNSMSSDSSGGGGGGSASAAADPFAGQRPQYQAQLSDLMSGKYDFSKDPSYQWALSQGLAAANTGAAASGLLNSGNRLLALQNYGAGAASTEYANQFSRLSQLAGANVGSPAAAGQIIANQSAMNQQASAALGNTVGKAVGGWMSGGSGSGSSSGSYMPEGTSTSGATWGSSDSALYANDATGSLSW